jgi:hypothetical protein
MPIHFPVRVSLSEAYQALPFQQLLITNSKNWCKKNNCFMKKKPDYSSRKYTNLHKPTLQKKEERGGCAGGIATMRTDR